MTVTAWRIAFLSLDGRIVSPDSDTGMPWDQARIAATCLLSPHPAPDPDCTCGVHAVTSIRDLVDVYEFPPDGRPVPVNGLFRAVRRAINPILPAHAVVTRVKLHPPILPGAYLTREPLDPPSTIRGAAAEITGIHLPPAPDWVRDRLWGLYRVPIALHTDERGLDLRHVETVEGSGWGHHSSGIEAAS